MNKIDEAVDRIRRLECPSGEIKSSVSLILEDYGVADSSEISVDRVSSLDRDEAEAYRVKIEGEKQAIIILAKSGYDGYVEKVLDAYTKP